MEGTQAWYSEVADCDSFPGCGGHGTGHFTAMIWHGVREIGCYTNSRKVQACRYRSGDTKSCDTANMGGCYDENVKKRVRSFSECKNKVAQCGLPVEGNYDSQGLFEVRSDVFEKLATHEWKHGLAWVCIPAGLAMTAVVGLVGFMVRRRVTRMSDSTCATLALEMHPSDVEE